MTEGCFWQDLVGVTQVCAGDPPEVELAFELTPVEGSGGGAQMFALGWFSVSPNLIAEALAAERDVEIVAFTVLDDPFDAWPDGRIELDPPLVIPFDQFGEDPYFISDSAWTGAGGADGLEVEIEVDFDPSNPGTKVASGTGIIVNGT